MACLALLSCSTSAERVQLDVSKDWGGISQCYLLTGCPLSSTSVPVSQGLASEQAVPLRRLGRTILAQRAKVVPRPRRPAKKLPVPNMDMDPATRPDELLKQPPPVAVQSPVTSAPPPSPPPSSPPPSPRQSPPPPSPPPPQPPPPPASSPPPAKQAIIAECIPFADPSKLGCIINVIAAEPGATLEFHLMAPTYPDFIDRTVTLPKGKTTQVAGVHSDRRQTKQAMLFFRGVVEYKGDAASRRELVYDDPRIVPVYTKQLAGEFAGYTEVGLELGRAGFRGSRLFSQMYANDDPYVAQAVWEIAQLKGVDWRAALAAPLPPSGRIIDRAFAPPSVKRVRRPINAECIPTFVTTSCACLIVVRDAEPGHDLRFEVQVEPQIVKELFQFKLPEGKSFGSTIWRGGPRSSGSCKLSATVQYTTAPSMAVPVASSDPGMIIKEIQDDCPPAEGCMIWFSIAVPVDPQVPMRYMTAIQSARSDSEEAKAARAQLAAQGGKPFKELLLVPTPPGGWIMGRRPQ